MRVKRKIVVFCNILCRSVSETLIRLFPGKKKGEAQRNCGCGISKIMDRINEKGYISRSPTIRI
nr:hypothetical protein [Methanosarcina sp. UBA5]